MKTFYKLYFICFLYLSIGWSKVCALIFKPKPRPKSILYLAAFFPHNAGYHWRVQKWSEIVAREGYKVEIASACTSEDLDDYSKNTYRFLIRFLHLRFKQVLSARHFETVIVRRELLLFNEYGNHFLEKLLRSLCRHLILDFDDDLAAAKKQPHLTKSLFARVLLKDGNSFRNSFAYYDKFMVASNYLKDYILLHHKCKPENILVLPTCVDYDKYPAKVYDLSKPLVFGWIGNTNNHYLLKPICELLEVLSAKYDFSLKVISRDFDTAGYGYPIECVDWSLETEVEELKSIDVGLMPLDYTEESKGKGGFKLIQYMGLGIVGCADGVTIINDIVTDGVDSFVVQQDNTWEEKLEHVLSYHYNLDEIGMRGKGKIETGFTFTANKELYLKFINLK